MRNIIRIGWFSIFISMLLVIQCFAEPRLEDLELPNCRLYATTRINLTDSIKDSGNEYLIRVYANEQLVDEQYGLFSNQLVYYTFNKASLVGKTVYLEIEGYNSTEIVRTEKKILDKPSGSASIIQNGDIVVLDCKDFDNTHSYSYQWYINNSLVSMEEVYKIQSDDYTKSLYCVVISKDTGFSVRTSSLVLTNTNSQVYMTNLKSIPGEWVHGINGDWYERKDGTHPVGTKNESGLIAYDWELIEGKWYAFNDLGYSVSGFITDIDGKTYYLCDGLVSGWKLINNKWYYFHTEHDGSYGMMYKDTLTPDNYIVDINGVWVQ